MAKKKKSKSKPERVKITPRFLAMSKLIGIFIMIAIIIIVAYSLYEMHFQHNLDSLPQLLVSVFGLGAVYIGFYLTMAKWEHVETEKTKRQQDLLKLKKELNLIDNNGSLEEQVSELEQQIDELSNKEVEIENEPIDPNSTVG